MNTIYFDHNATTPLHPDVFEAMKPYFCERFGNPSCLYQAGVDASYGIEKARLQVARLLNANEDELVFTGGGTESDNLAIKGIMWVSEKKHVITSEIEHPAVRNTCLFLQEYMGCRITRLPVDYEGFIDPERLKEAIRPDTGLITIMTANNEIGSIQPIEDIAKIAKEHEIPFHTDAIQAVGKIPFDVKAIDADLVSVSGHKINGPKGIGVLYVRKGTKLVPHLHGGNHENGLRSGTENVAGIVGVGKAADLARKELTQRDEFTTRLRNLFWEKLMKLRYEFKRNSPTHDVLPNTLNFSIPGYNSREIVRAINEEQICITSGSACSQGKETSSYVIKAVGRTEAEAKAAIRISLGYGNTEKEIDRFLELLPGVLQRVKERAE